MLKTSLKNNGAALYQELASNVCLHAEVFFSQGQMDEEASARYSFSQMGR